MPNKPPAKRILLAIGPGDVIMAYRDWKSGVRTPSETSITFSSQTFEALTAEGWAYWAVSSHEHENTLEENGNVIENRPKSPGKISGGLNFHFVQLRYAWSLLRSARRFGASHALVDSGTTHWFALALFRLAGVEVIANFHNVYWPVGYPPTRLWHRAFRALDALFFRSAVRHALGVSAECGRQVAELSRGRVSFNEYRAQFCANDFKAVTPASVPGSEVRLLFAGRIEINKGVFDLLTICEILNRDAGRSYVFEVCGDGTAFGRMHREVNARRLGQQVLLRGKLIRSELLQAYSRAHFVIVPTRSDFCEGLPMVCAEAVISGRPVVTSRLSNALEVLRGAVLEATENEPETYAEQIAHCVDDQARYERMVAATASVRTQFLDPRRGLAAVLGQLLRRL